MHIVGALNNDMIGWANDHRLDNTIRYSNAGIRDVQHAASFLTKLITYDARYFKSTDACVLTTKRTADIVGGNRVVSRAGNPHYHQPTDLLETVNHELVAETSKVTVASIMLLASSPSRVKDLKVTRAQRSGERRLEREPEKSVTGYIVAWGPATPRSGTRCASSSPRRRFPARRLGWWCR